MESNQELQHWGIKGQKWGIRRYQNPDGTLTEAGKKRYYYQNPDGSLTDEGKKHYMEAARKGKLNPKKLSDADLNMINQRFAKENTYKQNVKAYEESKFSYKLKNAVIERVKGNGGGGGGKKGGGGKGIGSLLAMPIKKAFEDALKFNPGNDGGNGGSDGNSKADRGYNKYLNNGHTWFKGYKPDGKDNMCITPNGQIKYLKKDKVDRGKEYVSSATKNYGVSSSAGGRMGTYNSSGGSEASLRARYKASHQKEKPKQTPKPKKYDGPGSDDYYKSWSFHADHMQFVVTRDDSDSIMHYGIKGQKWGVRRFQNEDRTLTEAGKERYSKTGTEIRKAEKEYDEKVKKGEYTDDPDVKDIYVMERIDLKRSIDSSDYKKERKKIADNRPEGFSEKENELINKIKNGEVIDNNAVDKIALDHHNKQSELGKQYQKAETSEEKEKYLKMMEHEQILMDYAYDKIPALNRENKYEKEILNETNPNNIDPSYRTFSNKSQKAAAEAEYLKLSWYGNNDDPDLRAREGQHISDRVSNLSYNGYFGTPQSERTREMFDYNPEGYRTWERWRPKYEKSSEWNKLQDERQMLRDRSGYTQAEKEYRDAYDSGSLRDNPKMEKKLYDAINKARARYNKRIDASDIKQRENKIEENFYKELSKIVLKDLGYEITDDNLNYIKGIIWYD